MGVEAGEIVTLVGPNGSGKTSLLKTLIGALTPSQGRVLKDQGLRLAYVPQKLHVEPMLPMTVARFLSLPKKKTASSIAQALTAAGVPGIEKQSIQGLSGGQFQRVQLARAMMDKPNLLLLDEATQRLDHVGIADFYHQIAAIRRDTNCAVLMVSHDLNVVMRQTDRVICLNTHICCQGKPDHGVPHRSISVSLGSAMRIWPCITISRMP
ncbi:ABC-type Mn/Zn transport system, ATPase component [Reinekea sp. MED297]|uniref:ABC-type Mn/Zn transport system, ATPase component n=2 Tax=Reinekea TaxID=230494 RepID=A4BAY2_9GAMM|nr:ABC-type Mn/Zn transport system, ATPase component [Reinekea sp. MED297] [Reinekea blandensis MED297]